MENQSNDGSPLGNANQAINPPVDERALLLQRAKLVGLNHSPNIGTDTLRQKLKDFLEGRADTADGEILEQRTSVAPREETPAERDQRLRLEIQAEQMAMVRVRVVNMNPQKADLQGEIWTVANKYVGTVRRYVPYDNENGWHIPKILLTLLQEQKFHQIKTKPGRDKREIVHESKLIKEFAIEILPPLTDAQMAELKASQMARGDGYNQD